jgi:serine/threonine protein kinase
MAMTPPRWQAVGPSKYRWEEEALDYLRAGLPDHEPFRAWSNFEFQTREGGIYEVDLLVLTKRGFWLVEVKSRPGKVGGDASLWTWEHEQRTISVDNPLILANRKAKLLAGLLRNETRCFRKASCPFIEPVIFLSAEDLRLDLKGAARARIVLRDRPPEHADGPRDGILAALLERKGSGLEERERRPIDAPVARAVAQAMEEIGVRASRKKRTVGEYVLGPLLDEGPGYQDFVAEHSRLSGVFARVRRYLIAEASNSEERDRLRRAAAREFRTLQTLDHPGILRSLEFKDEESGPVLIFSHAENAVGLDHYLVTHGHRLSIDQKLDFLRQIADAVRYAHRKKIIHRALSPKSVVVFGGETTAPKLQICYWHASVREGTSTTARGTIHPEALIDAPYLVYAAPESQSGDTRVTEAADVFSLGAIAYRLFSGRPPAEDRVERSRVLTEGRGLELSAVVDGAPRELVDLVHRATRSDLGLRFETVDEFLEQVDRFEDEITKPDDLAHPREAKKGERLLHGWTVERVLGKGSTARALLVRKVEPSNEEKSNSRCYVLKVALKPEDNERLREEGEVLRKLRSEYIVGFVEELDFDGTVGLLLETAGDQTLAEYLREEGSLGLDLLERFGENLLSALAYLERMGERHRDIKPENIGIIDYQKKRKQLVLFDFSLARAPLESIHVGTMEYLDPFLPLRPAARGKKPLWDESAERYSAAVTLHELATGVRPRWGDGRSAPAETDAELSIEAEQIDASVRETLIAFFRKGLDRDVRKRFLNAEEMLRSWRDAFQVDRSRTPKLEQGSLTLAYRVEELRLESSIVELRSHGLSTRAENALDRLDIVTVRDLLSRPMRELRFLRGVGKKTLTEILGWVASLRERFPVVDTVAQAQAPDPDAPASALSLEILYRRVVGSVRDARDATRFDIRRYLLGDHPEQILSPEDWPTQSSVADRIDVTRARVGQVIAAERTRWAKDSGLTSLRSELSEKLSRAGGILSVADMIDLVLALRRIDVASTPALRRFASVVARAAVEAELTREAPRFQLHRHRARPWIAVAPELVPYAEELGTRADEIAREDPLLASSRAIERLRGIAVPALPDGIEPLSDERLLRLAASASDRAALSPRLEIYPRDMDAERALRLGAGAVRALGFVSASTGESAAAVEFTHEDVQQRVAARYPEAGVLPEPPTLTPLLARIGLEVEWDAAKKVYRRLPSSPTTTSGSTIPARFATGRPTEREPITPEIAAAHQFEERLHSSRTGGSFLILTVRQSEMTRCEEELSRRLGVERYSIDERLIAAMREVARERGVDWNRVRRADIAPRDSSDWSNLLRLASAAAERLGEEILAREDAVLVVHPGLLARYDQIRVLETLRDEAGKRGRVRTCWVLVAADEQTDLPVLDGKEIPLLSPGQRTRVPRAWVENLHRSAKGA